MTTLNAIKSMNYSIRTTLAFLFYWAVVVAQLAERLLTISEVHRFETNYCQTFTVSFFKDENKEKRDRECPIFLNKTIHVLLYCRHSKVRTAGPDFAETFCLQISALLMLNTEGQTEHKKWRFPDIH